MNAIKAYRSRHSLTLEVLAERLGITKATVWKYENGVLPPIDVAIAISRATDFEVRVADLRPEIVDAVRAELERVLPSPEGAAA